ncbi:MAG: DegT/DnrJ/EryC1/StrS family aminotransferase, partial [Clostridiaceae bacterium]|nr:DegT/DnrJ/EryC1/StrS family aminotransferase [Clostridiaceae bacterium]
DENIGKELYKLKNFGIQSEVVVDGVGSNAKMNEFQAAMGICNLRHITEQISKRKTVVERYRKWLSDIDGIKIMCDKENVESNYAYLPVVFDEKVFGFTRNEVCDQLKENNIFARKYFYPLTNSFDCYHGKFDVNKTPVAQHIAKRVLTLPLYADLSLEDVDRICDIILKM